MNDLNHTLQNMGALQLLLALVFLGAYAVLLGGFVEGRAQAIAALVAALAASVFTARTDPWVHGVLLVAFVVVGMGLFIAVAWVVTRLAGHASGVETHSELFAAYPTQWLDEDETAQQLAARNAEAEMESARAPTPSALGTLGPPTAA
jgi:hypothetical protein